MTIPRGENAVVVQQAPHGLRAGALQRVPPSAGRARHHLRSHQFQRWENHLFTNNKLQFYGISWDIMGIATSKIVIKDNSSGGKNGD